MASYNINKGIGRRVEFLGLRSLYLVLFAVGLLTDFLLFVVLFLAGVKQSVCIGLFVVIAAGDVLLTFRLNRRLGEWGLLKLYVARLLPRRISSRQGINRLILHKDEKHS